MASKERKMRANLDGGGGGVRGPCDDAPLPQFPLVLTILYNQICINQNLVREILRQFTFAQLKLENIGLGVSFFLLVCKHTLLSLGEVARSGLKHLSSMSSPKKTTDSLAW
jgi:hypothetical protein